MTDITFQPLGNPSASGSLKYIADIDPRLTRTNYFDGRLLTAEDLTRDQIYVDQRLREIGRVLGSGVMSGLQLSFNPYNGLLTLQPGQALTPAGRVLELGSILEVDLGDRGLISSLNDGNYRRFNRALYAVVLKYVDVATDIAEVFPKDLGAKRGFEYALVTESVQMGLVPLPMPLPQQSEVQIRARLMRELLGNGQIRGLIPEDSVALGILAIQDDTPRWLDSELLRNPVRAEPMLGDIQSDLSRQYEKLLQDIIRDRSTRGLTGDFHAADYCSLIPPVGTLPKASVDPTNGRQSYFPENYQVAIAPMRQSDVELIKAESLKLPPIDLTSGEPVDIVVLVPLTNLDYGYYAAQLERGYDSTTRRLPQIDLLKLRLYPIKPVHIIDTDKGAWTSIWNRLGDDRPLYVRRPTRAAETAISGIVLALGAKMPRETPPDGGASSPSDGGGMVLDKDTVFLHTLNFDSLTKVRKPNSRESAAAYGKLVVDYGNSATVVAQCASILTYVGRQYDSVIWQTLLALADQKLLSTFVVEVAKADPTANTATVVAKILDGLNVNHDLVNQWTVLTA